MRGSDKGPLAEEAHGSCSNDSTSKVRLLGHPTQFDSSGLFLSIETLEKLAQIPKGEARVAVLNGKVKGAMAQALAQLQYAFAMVGKLPTVQVEHFIAEEEDGYWERMDFS
jgi:hypothetical protein